MQLLNDLPTALGEFMPLPEQRGDIIPIGSRVLQIACKQLKQNSCDFGQGFL